MTSNRELARHHIAALRAEGAGKLHLAGLLENLLGESSRPSEAASPKGEQTSGPPSPLYQGESGISGGPASQDVPASTHDQHGEAHDHLLALARNAYEAWRSLYRVAMPTGLGDVADGEWARTDQAMEALDRFMAYGGEFSTNPVALPADVEVGITAEMEPSPAFSGPFTPDPHVYRPDYHRGEKTQLCSVCGGAEHLDVHRRGAQLAREAITGKR